ncbi:MAG TPA: CaiB/BaiF CoA-transferase family protein [Dehalococcoidia bacterium]|nr:CaiB/BaiF CoA-transferase family protein [Dehalococcoidia bacterium]
MSLLQGIRVLDVTYGLAGPMATQVLVDFGAEILRVDYPGATRTPADLVRIRGRRSIAVDLTQPEGNGLVRRLVDQVDVLITEPGLDGRDPLRWSYEALAAANPGLVWCRVTGYGEEGPRAGALVHDHLIAARYGVYDQPGFRDGPTFVTGNIPSMGAALLAVQAIGTALYQRELTGKGQEVSVSLLGGALSFLPTIISASIDPPGGNPPPPVRRPAGAAPYYSIHECADGRYLHFGCLTPQFRRNATRALGLEAELEALGFETPAGRENNAEVIEIVAARMRQEPYEHWAKTFEAADVPYAEAQWTEDLLDNSQVEHEGLLVQLDDPTVGPMYQMGATAVVEGDVWAAPTPAPKVGQHTDEVCRDLGLSAPDIDRLRRAGVIA